jgi:hypothetical protein
MWHRRSGRTLTVSGYREAGGIHGAIAAAAERIYADFPAMTQQVVQRIMLRLVSVGEAAVTRRQLPRAELLAGLDEGGNVLARFTQARLVSADAAGVEIGHDILLVAWPRLRDWIDENRAGLRLRRQIADDARSWAALGRDPGSLYRGIRLASAQDWRMTGDNETDLTPLEREFLDASSAAEAEELAARARQRQADESRTSGYASWRSAWPRFWPPPSPRPGSPFSTPPVPRTMPWSPPVTRSPLRLTS